MLPLPPLCSLTLFLRPGTEMRFTTSFLVAATSCISAVYAGLEDVKTGKHLNAQTFDSAIKGKASLVAFYAPWWVLRSVLRWPAALACSIMRPGLACARRRDRVGQCVM